MPGAAAVAGQPGPPPVHLAVHGGSRFASAEQMQQLVEKGMAEGMQQAMGQIDELLGARV